MSEIEIFRYIKPNTRHKALLKMNAVEMETVAATNAVETTTEEVVQVPPMYSNEWRAFYNIPRDCHYSVLKLKFAPSAEVLRTFIGKKGCYFIKTTEEAGVYFIWHSKDFPNEIEIWGPNDEAIDKAKTRLWVRLFTIIDRMITSNRPVSQEEYQWASENYVFFKNLPKGMIIIEH